MRNVCANSRLYKSSNENNDLIGNRYYYKYTRAGYTHDICKFTFTKSYRTIRSKLQIYSIYACTNTQYPYSNSLFYTVSHRAKTAIRSKRKINSVSRKVIERIRSKL